MHRYLLSRSISAVVLLVAVTIINFVLTHVLPGNPVDALVGEFPAPPAYIAIVRHNFGLDRPLDVQLLLYFENLLHGNLGFSFANQQPVLPLVLQRSVFTLLLMLPALTVASAVGVALGGAAARRAGSLWDPLITTISVGGYSIPIFWLAQVLIVIFAVQLSVLPAQGMLSVTAEKAGLGLVGDYLRHLILPGFAIAASYMALAARVARASFARASHEDFALLALAKGLSRAGVFWRHVVPNGLIPVVTVIGYNFSYALTGAILTETVFGWPGVGYLFITSTDKRDYPVLDAIFLLATVTVILTNLLTDLTYAVIDPRVRRSYFRPT